MNPKVKKYLLHFILFGVMMALMMWATDVSEGKDFELVKFLTRILIFGSGFALVQIILDPLTEKKKKANKGQ